MEPKSLVFFLNEIKDTRKAKGKRHQQMTALTIIIMAMLCGKFTLRGIARFAQTHGKELQECMPLHRGKVPSFSMLQRLSHRLPIAQVCDSFNKWMGQYHTAETIAADGKSIASTVHNNVEGKQQFTSLVSFFGQKSQLIYQIGVLENDKRSEIYVVQELISKLQIKKAVFTLDALHCQKKTVQEIVNSGNGYVITVKGNQPKLYRAIEEKSKIKPEDAYSWRQAGHGHDAQCRIKVWKADDNMKEQWTGLQQYICVRRQGKRDGKEFDTTTYYITSESMSAWRLAQAIRGHRKIENTLHWTKDVVLDEDGCGLTQSQQAANMVVMRDISFNLLVMAGYKSISQGISAMGEKVETVWRMITGSEKKLQANQVVS